MNLTHLLQIVAYVIAVCSVLHMLLPPYEVLNDFPKAQKYYKLLVVTISYIAANKREDVVNLYKSVSEVNKNADGTLQK